MNFKTNFFDDPAVSWSEKGFIGYLLFKYKIGQSIPLTYEVKDIYRINKYDIPSFTDEEILDIFLMYGFAESPVLSGKDYDRDEEGILWCRLIMK